MIFALLAWMALPPLCLARHPGKVFHANNLAAGLKGLNLEYSYEYEQTDGDGPITRTQELTPSFTWSLFDSWDLVFQTPVEYVINSPGENYTGPDDWEVDAKWTFHDEGSLALALYGEVTFPTGDYENGSGKGRATFAVSPVVSYPTKKVAWNFSATYKHSANKINERVHIFKAYANPAVHLSPSLDLVVNLGLESDTDPDRSDPDLVTYLGLSWSRGKWGITPGVEAEFFEGETDITGSIDFSYAF